MKAKIIALLVFTSVFCISCNDNKINSSSNSSNTSSTSTSVDASQEAVKVLNSFKEKLNSISYVVSKEQFDIKQTDNYYGMDMEVGEKGESVLYNGDFVVTNFTQSIGDSKVTGRREMGIAENNNLYQINYFGEGDSDNSVFYFLNNDYNKKVLLSLDFVTDYINNIINVTLSYYEAEGLKLSLITNYDSIDLSKDGTVLLQYRFINYAANGVNKSEEVQRDDELVIKNGKIISSSTTMIYSIEDGVNYKYLESKSTYSYDSLTDYPEEKLNPSDFKVVTGQ